MSSRRQIFISHDSGDIGWIEYLVQPLKYFPFEPYIAIKEHEAGELKRIIDSNLRQSDVLLAFISDRSVDNRWVNQEVGFAKGQEKLLIPVFESSSLLSGFLKGTMGVKNVDDDHETIYGIISKLRREFSPLDGFGPDWCIQFRCNSCDEVNYFPIRAEQSELFAMYERDEVFARTCNACRTCHMFNPASFHYLGVDEDRR